jgi:hypothetical protein
LNTNANLAATTLCSQAGSPSTCSGWVQFVYWGGYSQIWYNLVGVGSKCPGIYGSQTGPCYYRAPNESAVPAQDITNLVNMTLTGLAGGATDTVIVTTGEGHMYAAANTSLVNLSAAGWTEAEFNVFGNDSGAEASFNAGTTLNVQLLTDNATASAFVDQCTPGGTTAEKDSLTLVPGSCCPLGGDTPGILFSESNVSGATASACPGADIGGGEIAASQQFGLTQTDVFTIDENGALAGGWAGGGAWSDGVLTGGANVFVPGAPLAASQQFGLNQTDVFTVGSNGQLTVNWVQQAAWAGPMTIGSQGTFPVGASVAASQQFGLTQTDAFAVDNKGALTVSWVDGGGAWNGPTEVSATGYFWPGSPVAALQQASLNQTDVLAVDSSGRLNVSWVQQGGWSGPLALSPAASFPANGHAHVAASQQCGLPQTDVFVVDNNGALTVSWVDNGGAWKGPLEITGTNLFPPGAPVAASQQFGVQQTDVFVVDLNGALNVVWVDGGGSWNPPLAVTPAHSLRPGSGLAVSQQTGLNQTDVFARNAAGDVSLSWVGSGGAWQGPMTVTSP